LVKIFRRYFAREDNVMLSPVIEGLRGSQVQVDKPRRMLAASRRWSIALIVGAAVDVEAVEVVVLPTHHDLNDVVQLGQRRELTDEDSPPDHGADLKRRILSWYICSPDMSAC
jgi:hypothetical protein